MRVDKGFNKQHIWPAMLSCSELAQVDLQLTMSDQYLFQQTRDWKILEILWQCAFEVSNVIASASLAHCFQVSWNIACKQACDHDFVGPA